MNYYPIRIQRKRVKGWKAPENTVSVTRPGPFGNPFTPVKKHNEKIRKEAVEKYEVWLRNNGDFLKKVRQELRGKNLMCFCRIGSVCHADVLLKYANQ